jgi:hypothetical protein
MRAPHYFIFHISTRPCISRRPLCLASCSVANEAADVCNSCPYRKSNPDVLMVQTSEMRGRDDAANGLNSTRRWCILVQR